MQSLKKDIKANLIDPQNITPQLRQKINPIKNRILFLSPSVASGEQRQCKKEDFQSLSNSNIGVGGFGKVYKVRHKLSGNVYAIKVINKSKILENQLAQQVKLELRIMYSLNHEYVIKLYNHFEDNDNFYLILQLAEGGQLYSKLKKQGYFSEKVAAQYMRELVSSVEYLHSLDPPVIHRDIKPENILIDKEGRVKLADFGWSNFFEHERQTYCGTPQYLAPEMINKSGHGHSIDLWNLGILIYELLTGSPPFQAKSQKELFNLILTGKIKFSKTRPVSAEANDLVNKLLKQNPKDRITLQEMKKHAWFKKHKLLREMIEMPTGSKKILVDAHIEKENYEIISKESLINKENITANYSAIQSFKTKVKKLTESGSQVPSAILSPRAVVDKKQLGLLESQNQELKLKYELKCKELDDLQKKYNHLVKNSNNMSMSEENSLLSVNTSLSNGGGNKSMQQELMRLRKLQQDRQNILRQVQARNEQLRESSIKLRQAQLKIDTIEDEKKSFERRVKQMTLKINTLESENKASSQKLQGEKDNKHQVERQMQSKIDKLQYEMLRKGSSESSFEKLLSLCKYDLQQIMGKFENEKKNSDTEQVLRNKLLDSQKEAYESKVKIQQERFKLTREHTTEVANITSKFEKQKREIEKQYQKKIEQMRERIRELEMIEYKEKHDSQKFKHIENQLSTLSEDNTKLKQKMAGLDKAQSVSDDYITKLNQKIRVLTDQVDMKNHEISKLKGK